MQAFGVSEPSVGSDTARIQTMATRSEDGYVIRFVGFKKAFWEWRDEPNVRRTFATSEAAAACRYCPPATTDR